jgi:hypothetical protein
MKRLKTQALMCQRIQPLQMRIIQHHQLVALGDFKKLALKILRQWKRILNNR